MNNEVIANLKVHLLFAAGFLIALTFGITTEIVGGQRLPGAIWNTVSQIRPMEYAMFALFWYVCAVHKARDERNGSLTTLNLRDTGR